MEEVKDDQLQELSIEDIRTLETYDKLLEQHKEVLKIAIGLEKLYREERQNKLEALELAKKMTEKYEAEQKERNLKSYFGNWMRELKDC
ncbi:MAG: hypothetical protein ACOCRX_12145 [Candidatus Woesearchaeota archaeon]